MTVEPLHTPEATAKILGMSCKTLREHVRYGRIRSIKIGNGVKRPRRAFTDKNIQTFIENQKVREAAPCPSTKIKGLPTTGMTSKSTAVAFTDLQKLKASGKLKP